MAETGRDRDLVLPQNTFAFILDSSKGKVSVCSGPFKNSLSNTDQLVVWDQRARRFVQVDSTERATQVFPLAAEGQYMVLSNPVAGNNKELRPTKGQSNDAVELEIGRKLNVPGPVSFPLWPGQTANVIDGHHLRHNQFLIVRVYDEDEAKKNWRSAVVKRQTAQQPAAPQGQDGEASAESAQAPIPLPAVTEHPPELFIGQLMLVKGTEVSFYIPPTGIEVVPEQVDKFVREAVTLERLEYCILLDENGEKDYRQGPDVVFPEPTQRFVENLADNSRKFRAIELNEHSGLYIKVIAEYEEDGKRYKVGDELFITGKEQAIYFPRPEHSIIEYGATKVHYAIAIPAGEGRYVLDRDKGTVDLIVGPKMFLPDPRRQVVVRRILDPQTVALLYPGNKQALDVNARLQQESAALTKGEYLRSAADTSRAALVASSGNRMAADEYAGDSFRRGTSYSPPRTITLDTKYEGAVAVSIWPGYAIQISDKTGHRRVEVGPKTVLLTYDETLMPLELSTGRPKSDKTLLTTAYLRVLNNQVSDRVEVETKDLVKVSVDVSYRVNFTGTTDEQRLKWFDVENYVKVLTDHGRSRMRQAAKQHGIQDFYSKTIDVLRDGVLGKQSEGAKRPGLSFEENGMQVYDLEILNVEIEDSEVSDMLDEAQRDAFQGAMELASAEEKSVREIRLEALALESMKAKEATAEAEAEVAMNKIERTLKQRLAQTKADKEVAEAKHELTVAERADEKAATEQRVELARLEATQFLEKLQGETEEYVKRMGAISPQFATALQMFADQHFVEGLVKAIGPAAIAAGTTTADLFAQIFKDTPFESVMKTMAQRPLAVSSDGARRS